MNRSGLIEASGYFRRIDPGFLSSGALQETGTEKSAARIAVRPNRLGTMEIGHERVRYLASSTADLDETTVVQWRIGSQRHDVTFEYQDRRRHQISGPAASNRFLAGRLRSQLHTKLVAHIEQQGTLDGENDNRTTLGFEYTPVEALSLLAAATAGSKGNSASGGLSYRKDGTKYLSDPGAQATSSAGAKSRPWSEPRRMSDPRAGSTRSTSGGIHQPRVDSHRPSVPRANGI